MTKQNRYIRQISLPQVGNNGQDALSKAKVLVIGAGGLGNAILPYLASSGVGAIGVIDGDDVAESNLHRQVLFSEEHIGQKKAWIAAEKLNRQFSDVSITPYNHYFTAQNALELCSAYDIIVDATDAIQVRYLINDACVITKKPFVHASVYRFQFQVATFNAERSGTYRCLYPNAPKTVQSCEEAGVMPSTVAMAGMYQANEVFKIILGIGNLITNEVLLVDTLSNQQHRFAYSKQDNSYITPLFFERTHQTEKITMISYQDILDKEKLLLDVRRHDEQPFIENKDLLKIPEQELEQELDKINKEIDVYVFCKSGVRSRSACQILQKHNFKNVYQLKENAEELKSLIQ